MGVSSVCGTINALRHGELLSNKFLAKCPQFLLILFTHRVRLQGFHKDRAVVEEGARMSCVQLQFSNVSRVRCVDPTHNQDSGPKLHTE